MSSSTRHAWKRLTFLESLRGPTGRSSAHPATPGSWPRLHAQAESGRQRKLQEDQLQAAHQRPRDDADRRPVGGLEVTLPESQTRPLRLVEGRIEEFTKTLDVPEARRPTGRSNTGGRGSSGTSTTPPGGGTASDTSDSSPGSSAPPAPQRLPYPPAPDRPGDDGRGGSKGVFLFLQEVLVADMTQLTLFDIPQQVLPQDVGPRPLQVQRAGLGRAAGAVHSTTWSRSARASTPSWVGSSASRCGS